MQRTPFQGAILAALMAGLLALPVQAQTQPPAPQPQPDCQCGVPDSPRGPR